jgi:GNAT superfamily N-acetyltransferase
MSDIQFRQADRDEILPLRYAVLCTGRPWAEAVFIGDDDEHTRHYGAFIPTPRGGAVVGCVSYMLTQYEGESAWQLRGMATRPDLFRAGVGRRLVGWAQRELLAASPVRVFWCKARVAAITFYEKLGWRVCSEEFVIENYGPHKKMMLRL